MLKVAILDVAQANPTLHRKASAFLIVKVLYIHLGTLVLEKKPKKLTYWAVVKN